MGMSKDSKKSNANDNHLTEQKKNKTFFSVFFGTILTIFKLIIPLAVLLGILVVIFIIAGAEKIDVDDLNLDLTSAVCYVDDNGDIQEFEKVSSTGKRDWVALSKIPKDMQEAFISIEDERFRTHNGVDIKRTTKAVIDYIFKRSKAQGGSTITQQLVKNLTGNDKRTPIRKIQEMWLAYQLERKKSKDQILELYLNTIYLAQGVNGVQTASKLYFDKDVSELTLAQCASIAGITQSPTYYDPFLNPQNNKDKQEVVLKKMLELGKITQEEHDKAVAEKLNFKKGNMQVAVQSQTYFTEQVIIDATAALVNQKGMSEAVAKRKITNGGYKIVSTMDKDIQESIDKVFSSKKNFPLSDTQGAIVVMDVKNGEVKGMYGGIGPKEGAYPLNRATGAYRQPGSSVKPLSVYAPAVDTGLINPATRYTDKKVTYGDWSPKNSYSGYKGEMTVRTAVQLSVNTVAVQIVDELGVNKSYDYLKNKFHMSQVNDNDKVLGALALGGLTKGVSVMEMASAYCVFPNSGIYNSPITFTKIIDSTGKVILKNKSTASTSISKSSAATMNDLLKSVVTSGTGRSANISGINIAGKTGTSDDNKDKWFVGYTKDYCAAIWYGYDTPKAMSLSTNPSVTAWKKVMQPVLQNKKSDSDDLDMSYQTNKKSVEICTVSGLLPSDYCRSHNTVKTSHLSESQIPKSHCSAEKHKQVEQIDPDTAETPNQTHAPSQGVTNSAPNQNQSGSQNNTSGNQQGQGETQTPQTPSQTTPPSNNALSELENAMGQ